MSILHGALGLVLVWVLMVPLSARAETAIRSTLLVPPRPFGYVIGDQFHEDFVVELNEPYRLETDTLPRPGRLNRWLALRRVAVETVPIVGGTRYRVGLGFQILSVPPTPARVYIPARSLELSDGGPRLSVSIPSRGLTVSPLVLPADAAASGVLGIQPDHRPPAIPTGPMVWRLAGIGTAMLILCILLAAIYLIVPLWRGANAPFARAYRQLNRLRGEGPAEDRVQAALRTVHGAIDRTAGRVVLEGDLAVFLARFPHFSAVREPLEEFFQRSRAVFFGAGPGAGVDPRDLDALRALCRRCRRLERMPP